MKACYFTEHKVRKVCDFTEYKVRNASDFTEHKVRKACDFTEQYFRFQALLTCHAETWRKTHLKIQPGLETLWDLKQMADLCECVLLNCISKFSNANDVGILQ